MINIKNVIFYYFFLVKRKIDVDIRDGLTKILCSFPSFYIKIIKVEYFPIIIYFSFD